MVRVSPDAAVSFTNGRLTGLDSSQTAPLPWPNTGILFPMMHRKLKPSGDHILIEYAEASGGRKAQPSEKTPNRAASAARVIAVGPGREGADGTRVPLGLKVGERIFVEQDCGVKIRLNRRSYAVIRKRDLIGTRA